MIAWIHRASASVVVLVGFVVVLSRCGVDAVIRQAPVTPAAVKQVPAPPPTMTSTTMWQALGQGPLKLPTLQAGSKCVRAQGKAVAPGVAVVVGKGPVYAAGLGVDGILTFSYPPPHQSQFAGSQWSGNKVLWVIDPIYRGPVLIRGHRLDGPEELRFDGGLVPPPELHIPAGAPVDPTQWRDIGSYTRLRAPGCYAYQVDGEGFSQAIIFVAAQGH